MKHNTLPMVYDNSRPARIGLLRRDAVDADNVQWFEVRPLPEPSDLSSSDASMLRLLLLSAWQSAMATPDSCLSQRKRMCV